MAEKKVDRRALKTQKQIKEALAKLLADKGLRHITVQEISDLADVHRVTFYKHYLDVYDLYEKLEKELLTELGLLILRFHEEDQKDFRKGLIDYIAQNPNTFRMVFSPHNTGEMRSKFSNMIEGIFRVVLTEKCTVDLNDGRLDYLSAYWASGFFAVIEKWVQNGFSQSEEFIILMLKGFDESTQDHMTKMLKK